MFSNSYCDSNCIGGPDKPVPAEVRHPVCVTPEDGFRVPGKKNHFLIISNNYCMVLGTEAQPVDALCHVLREQVAVLSSVTSYLPRIDMRTP